MPTSPLTYASKVMSAANAVELIRDHDNILVPTAAGEPPTILTALGERRASLRGVKVWQTLPLREYGLTDPATAHHVRYAPLFLGGTTRPGAAEGWATLMPAHFSEMPEMIRRGQIPCQVVAALASLPDEHGNFSVSLGTDYTPAAAAMARDVILEINPNVPYAYGGNHINIDQVSALVESHDPLIELPSAPPTLEEQAMGKFVADLIPDGATVQMGIGGVPNAVVALLKSKNDLGIHSEMLGDGILDLVEAGAITNARKNIRPGVMLATFALGTERLYRWMHRNPALEMQPVDLVNDPYFAGQIDRLHAVNGTMQIDFFGQCGSESIGVRPYSGSGGQMDFVRAANRSKGGKSIMVVPATAKNGTVSCIVPTLALGTQVTTHKNDVDYVVTEFGVAQLRGKSYSERAELLIGIAHPAFREELTAEARRMRLR